MKFKVVIEAVMISHTYCLTVYVMTSTRWRPLDGYPTFHESLEEALRMASVGTKGRS